MNPTSETDARWMDEALREAARGVGLTAPNPPVGALVVRDGQIVGRGFHPAAGRPHAEVFALREAGAAARGATLVVTLEPCSTFGRTPPCTEAILGAGIRRVVAGCTDPNPAHAGRGFELLRAAGLEVVTGVRDTACRELIRAFAYHQRSGRPYLSLKLACSLDGRIADARGASRWITGSAARARVQSLRREADAILVGTETVRLDNPSLLPRPAYGRRPLRIIPDRVGRLPLNRRVFTDPAAARTLCLLGPDVTAVRIRRLEALGVEPLRVPVRREQIQWTEVLDLLGARGLTHLLCEGGGQLAAALLRTGEVQEIHWLIAPRLLGVDGRPAVADRWRMDQAPGFRLHAMERCGEDVWLELRP